MTRESHPGVTRTHSHQRLDKLCRELNVGVTLVGVTVYCVCLILTGLERVSYCAVNGQGTFTVSRREYRSSLVLEPEFASFLLQFQTELKLSEDELREVSESVSQGAREGSRNRISTMNICHAAINGRFTRLIGTAFAIECHFCRISFVDVDREQQPQGQLVDAIFIPDQASVSWSFVAAASSCLGA